MGLGRYVIRNQVGVYAVVVHGCEWLDKVVIRQSDIIAIGAEQVNLGVMRLLDRRIDQISVTDRS